jgi:hypothetical protein
VTQQRRQHFVGEREVGEFKTCRYCPVRLVWVRTESGKAMPLEYDSRVTALGGGWLLEAHWGNCPGADAAREKAARFGRRAHREVS